MIAFSCILLILSGLVLMVSQGVGPFAREPWEDYHLQFRALAKSKQTLFVSLSALVAILSTLVLIGVIPQTSF